MEGEEVITSIILLRLVWKLTTQLGLHVQVLSLSVVTLAVLTASTAIVA